jgi:hypothetical protein
VEHNFYTDQDTLHWILSYDDLVEAGLARRLKDGSEELTDECKQLLDIEQYAGMERQNLTDEQVSRIFQKWSPDGLIYYVREEIIPWFNTADLYFLAQRFKAAQDHEMTQWAVQSLVERTGAFSCISANGDVTT